MRTYRKSAHHQAQAAARAEKALDMAQRYESGSTLQEIGDYYGITRERVRQLIKGELGMTGKDGGVAKRGREKAASLAAGRERRYLAKHGMSYAEYWKLNRGLDSKEGSPAARFRRQRANASTRGISWDLTFAEWWRIWQESGKWSERGRGRGYVMSRHGDKGPYATWNVRIIPAPQNSSEFIRRYHAEVKAGVRTPAKGQRTNPVWTLAVGESVTIPFRETARNYAYQVSSQLGAKISTARDGNELTVTRIA